MPAKNGKPPLRAVASNERVPPHDLDLEAAVLSACLLRPATLTEVRSLLGPESFFAEANRQIFTAACAVVDGGSPLDIGLLAAELQRNGRLRQVGGTPYLYQISDATPAVANVEHHAIRVRELWERRTTLAKAQELAALIYAGDFEAAERVRGEIALTTRPSSLQVLGPDAIWAPLEEPRFIVQAIIRAGALTEIVAYGSSGKSWMAADVTVSIAAGVPALDRFHTRQGRALYLDYEAGSYEMRRRFQAVALARGIATPVDGVELASMPQLYMTAPDFESRLMALAEGRDLIVFDTLRAASPGIDENDSAIRTGLDAGHRVTERTGCAMLVLTHAKKVSGTATTVDPREAGRGSSAIFDAADVVFHVFYRKGEPLRVEQTKSRLGRYAAPFLVQIADTENGGVRVRAEDAPSEETAAADAFSELCDRVLAVVRANPGATSRFVGSQSRARIAAALSALEHLERNGAVRNKGTEQRSKWFPTGGAECDS